MAAQAPLALSNGSISSTTAPGKIIAKRPPFYLEVTYFLSVWFYKGLIAVGLWAKDKFIAPPMPLLSHEIKIYDIRPNLQNRIFRPPSPSPGKLPLYLDVHGGGWCVGEPRADDDFCSFLARHFNMIVVAIDYHKSPTYKFPCAVDDVVAVAYALIKDESLNIDTSKIALGGFSAGGNIAFAAAQSDALRGKISALVGMYPALDLSETVQQKLENSHLAYDMLALSAGFLSSAYVPEGTNLRDPLISPAYAEPQDLAPKVYMIGAELDMLCFEAQRMAEDLVKVGGGEREIVELPGIEGWKQGSIRWETALGKEHAFTHVFKWTKEAERLRWEFCEAMFDRIGKWLMEEVWVKSDGS
jgi:acetyl esterase/lipase